MNHCHLAGLKVVGGHQAAWLDSSTPLLLTMPTGANLSPLKDSDNSLPMGCLQGDVTVPPEQSTVSYCVDLALVSPEKPPATGSVTHMPCKDEKIS